MEILTESAFETKKLGEELAKKVLKRKIKKRVFCLVGELGSGKTTFLKGFAKGLGIKERILSPTFVIMRKFKIRAQTLNFEHFYHIDCYRIEKPKEILDLGFKEIVKNPENIVAIEWAERIKKIIPKNAAWIFFKFLGKNKRVVFFE